MDSGNSGSLQSSSGGDEEYDSRAAAAADHSIYLNTQPPPQPPSMFDPFSNYTQQLHHQNPNNFSNNNPNPGWPGSTPIRSDPNPDPHQHNLANPFMSSFQPPPAAPAPGAETTSTANPGGGPGSTAARNPRKRSRASRRAPTTVLTTDTTNFRSMVQEFTGIPAPPFSNPSFPRSNRLDNLFGSRSGSFDSSGPQFLRRPFSQRGQTPSFLVPSSTNNNIISPVSNNYPFSHIQTSNNNLLNNLNNNQNQNDQNPLFSNLFQTNPSKFIFSSSSVMASKPHNPGSFDNNIPSNDMKIGPSLDEFGLGGPSHGNHQHVTTTLNDLPNLISSDQARARNDREGERDSENAAKWRRNINNNNNGTEAIENENGRDGYNNEGDQIKPVNGGYEFSGSTSSFLQGEKGPGQENVAITTRAGDQGMVESWIYSSE